MTERDIDSVHAIERSVFPHPWSREFFRLIITDSNNYVITLRVGNQIIGYGGYHLLKNRRNILLPAMRCNRIVHLINIAIHPSCQRRGFGTYLMNALLTNARGRRAEFCYLELRTSNTAAYCFYRTFDFNVIGMIENYYPRENEDAMVMGLDLRYISLS
jgi:ribosomal-protein-alanine N-acetyltransferase